MPTITISGAGAHASADAADRIPAMKSPYAAGNKGYLTPAQIRAFALSLSTVNYNKSGSLYDLTASNPIDAAVYTRGDIVGTHVNDKTLFHLEQFNEGSGAASGPARAGYTFSAAAFKVGFPALSAVDGEIDTTLLTFRQSQGDACCHLGNGVIVNGFGAYSEFDISSINPTTPFATKHSLHGHFGVINDRDDEYYGYNIQKTAGTGGVASIALRSASTVGAAWTYNLQFFHENNTQMSHRVSDAALILNQYATPANLVTLKATANGILTVGGTVVTSAGSVSAPAVAVGDADTGFFLQAAGNLSKTIDGVELERHNTTGLAIGNAAFAPGFPLHLVRSDIAANFQMEGDGFAVSHKMYRYTADAGGPTRTSVKARGTRTSPAAPVTNDQLLADTQYIHDGTTIRSATQIVSSVIAGTPSATDAQGRLTLGAAASAAVTITEVLRIQADAIYAFGGTVLVYNNGLIKRRVYTVATLPSASTYGAGSMAQVSDSNTAHTAGIGAIVAAGGANNVPVISDGTNWRIG